MAVRNQHARQSYNYTFKDIDGTSFMFAPAPFVYMSKVRYVANKAVKGKIKLDPSLRLVEVQEDGSIQQRKI